MFFCHGDFCKIPNEPGLYAFYIDFSKLNSIDIQNVVRLLRLSRSKIEVKSIHGYGVSYSLRGQPDTNFSRGGEKVLSADIGKDSAWTDAVAVLRNLYADSQSCGLPFFNIVPPVYIGITERTLKERVYEEHVDSLESYWQDLQLLELRATCQAASDSEFFFQSAKNELRVKDSFPLRAFYCCIPSTALRVFVLPSSKLFETPLDEDSLKLQLDYLEDIMHILTYPCLGKD